LGSSWSCEYHDLGKDSNIEPVFANPLQLLPILAQVPADVRTNCKISKATGFGTGQLAKFGCFGRTFGGPVQFLAHEAWPWPWFKARPFGLIDLCLLLLLTFLAEASILDVSYQSMLAIPKSK